MELINNNGNGVLWVEKAEFGCSWGVWGLTHDGKLLDEEGTPYQPDEVDQFITSYFEWDNEKGAYCLRLKSGSAIVHKENQFILKEK